MFSLTKILTVCSVVSTMLLSSAVTAQSQQVTRFIEQRTVVVDVPTIPPVKPNHFVFMCVLSETNENVVVSGLYGNVAEGNEGCSLVEGIQVTYISAVQSAYPVLIEGDLIGVGLYTAQAFGRSHTLVWVSHIDPQLADPKDKGDSSCEVAGRICRPPLKPVVTIREVMVAEVAK